eukprot:TRINITY_DN5314_c0_g1_i1.p2 TRINITY_DN5314_c0_g1~~TRINITY_DN5314_c0_g1_i1.p2  ORF type:complete len:104 (+),score=15.07 TRINITY_DN5314_c0_g1_i1:39-314(+)
MFADVVEEISDPYKNTIERLVSMGYDKEGVGMALAVYGDRRDAQQDIVKFCDNFKQLKGMGFSQQDILASLVQNKHDVQAAINTCLMTSNS